MEEEKRRSTLRTLKNTGIAIGIVMLTVIALVFTPLRMLLPGYLTPQSRDQIITFALRMDSLEKAVTQQNMYVTNLQDILNGRVHTDSIISIDSLTALRATELMEQSEREKEFARQYEEAEQYNLTTQASRVSTMTGLTLGCPVRGIISHTFAPDEGRFGIEISAEPNIPVNAIMEGTVIISSYTADDGYTILLQHNGELVSIYAHCGALLCTPGTHVHAGDAIATTTISDIKHPSTDVHFELWHKGIALDPSIYIPF